MTSFYKPIVTFLFGLLLSGYLWIRNEMSDKWIVFFGATAIAQQLLESGQSLFINNLPVNGILTIVSYILFLIHPILNILGSYTQMENGISFEPIVLCYAFIFYKLIVNPIKSNEFFTSYNKGGYIANWFDKINKYELIAYFALLLIPMYLYKPPKNVLFIGGTLITFFISYSLNRRNLGASLSLWYKLLLGLLFSNVLFL
jgi:hypothetical protein